MHYASQTAQENYLTFLLAFLLKETHTHLVTYPKQMKEDTPLTNKDCNSCTQKELLSLPRRARNKDSKYDNIAFVNTRMVHESRFNLIAIVGINSGIPVEIAAYCDHVYECKFNADGTRIQGINMDMLRCGATRIFAHGYRVEVGASLSSTSIEFVKICKPKQ